MTCPVNDEGQPRLAVYSVPLAAAVSFSRWIASGVIAFVLSTLASVVPCAHVLANWSWTSWTVLNLPDGGDSPSQGSPLSTTSQRIWTWPAVPPLMYHLFGLLFPKAIEPVRTAAWMMSSRWYCCSTSATMTRVRPATVAWARTHTFPSALPPAPVLS